MNFSFRFEKKVRPYVSPNGQLQYYSVVIYTKTKAIFYVIDVFELHRRSLFLKFTVGKPFRCSIELICTTYYVFLALS